MYLFSKGMQEVKGFEQGCTSGKAERQKRHKKILLAEHWHQAGCMSAMLCGPGRGLRTVLVDCKGQWSS